MFSKESARHLYDFGVYFWFDLRCLGGHSETSPASLGGGGLKSIFLYGYCVFNGVNPQESILNENRPPRTPGQMVVISLSQPLTSVLGVWTCSLNPELNLCQLSMLYLFHCLNLIQPRVLHSDPGIMNQHPLCLKAASSSVRPNLFGSLVYVPPTIIRNLNIKIRNFLKCKLIYYKRAFIIVYK